MHDFKWVSFVFSLSTKGYPSVGPAAGWSFLQRAEHFKWLWPRGKKSELEVDGVSLTCQSPYPGPLIAPLHSTKLLQVQVFHQRCR